MESQRRYPVEPRLNMPHSSHLNMDQPLSNKSAAQFKQPQLNYQRSQGSVQQLLWQQRFHQRQPSQKSFMMPSDRHRSSVVSNSSSTGEERVPLSPVSPNINHMPWKQESNQQKFHQNDYCNHHLHTGELPSKFIKNVKDPIEGYPKLQKLFKLKEQQVSKYATKPYGCRVEPNKMVETLQNWIMRDNLVFDVIMIGALTENQFIYPLLSQLPIDKLCTKPGFLFIWASTQKISELTKLLSNNPQWTKKFRRSEELVFIPVDKNSNYYPYKDSSTIEDEKYFQKMQWHCWMAITGTVRRSSDNHLINCNINTDLAIENDNTVNNAVPPYIYQVAENFSSSTRRLHIIPSKTGLNKPVKVRKGWVILSSDVLLNNFDPERYKQDLAQIGNNIPIDDEIEQLRPKSPVQRPK